jgi:hypothetical protein
VTPEEVAGLNVAFNEAALGGVELVQSRRRLGITLAALSLQDDVSPMPADPRLAITLEGVGRIAVSWRAGRWDDTSAPPIPLELEALSQTIDSFGHSAMYGWRFIDAGDEPFADAEARLSLDLRLGPEREHTFDVFQEGRDAFIELRAWFRTLSIRRIDPGGTPVPVSISAVIADGRRWWDAMEARDPRTAPAGIFPMKGS